MQINNQNSINTLPIQKCILLYGKSGTRKTLLAQTLASECKITFLSCSGSEFVDSYAGRGAARVRDLFRRARKQSPAIILIDEIESLEQKRETNASKL